LSSIGCGPSSEEIAEAASILAATSVVQTLAARVTDTPTPTPTPALIDSALGDAIAAAAKSYLTDEWDQLGTAKWFEVIRLEERSITKAMEANNVQRAFCVLLDYVAEIESSKAIWFYYDALVDREYEQYVSVVMVKQDDTGRYTYFYFVDYDGYVRDHKTVLENASMPVLGQRATTNTPVFSQCMSQD